MNELTLKNINVSLGNRLILNDINIEVKKGELISLLGPSGCGKTTLLKTIAGLIEADSGNIIISGINCDNILTEQRGTVIVFQDLRLFPHMNVIENVEFGLKMKGEDKKVRREKAYEILERVELKGFEKRRVNSLSGGQRQRVAIARAVTAQPKILLLDEPFSSLDKSLRIKMRELMAKIHKELGMTTIMVTHDEEEAFLMSDRVAVMIDGTIRQYNAPKEIYERPSCIEVANLLGQTNYIKGQVVCGKFKSIICEFNTDKTEGKYLLMFRPRDIKINRKLKDYKVVNISYLGGEYIITVEKNNKKLLINSIGSIDIKCDDRVGVDFQINKGIFYRE